MGEAPADYLEFAAARSGPLLRTACLLTGDWHLAEDLVQETLHLPHGGTVSDLNASDDLIQLVYDDGRGKNMVQVDAQYDMTAFLAGHMGCAGVEGDCEATTLADGTEVKKVEGPSEKGGSAVVWLVDILYPDGRRVAVREVDSYAESAPVTRPRPALSMDELLAIARDKRYFTG
ncbi:hypothetical protein [Streptomyces sp. NPDC005890]|uniref:hypothetical protein n=1 Tax=Streptomyces sp. NPDC005890 TaxID=3154568 RepID=UPI0033E5F1A9